MKIYISGKSARAAAEKLLEAFGEKVKLNG